MKVTLYDVALDIDFKGLTYSGISIIHFSGTGGVVELDCQKLEIESVSIGGKEAAWKYDRKEHRLSVNTDNHQRLKCKIIFSGKVVDGGLQGFYKSKSRDDYILTTQFEPTGARSFIPCIDNPNYKAVFKIRVSVDRGLSVISNTPIINKAESNGKVEFTFEPTPKMSTYLLYLGVGRFAESSRKDGSLHLVAASTRGQRGKGTFAMSNAIKFLREYEKFYTIPYPLQKLHLIAVPEFAVGAMENWGSITFREYALLVDKSTSEYNKRLVAIVLAHEIAHQWFGNLVTMKWWNDLWLNESFATYMSNKIVDRIYPGWNIWSDFILSETGRAMHADSLQNTHPIEVKVVRPEEISEIFDEISYGKGASVLRMIDSYLGSTVFRKGVSAYLKKFTYGNAESSDLWNALGKASGEDIGQIMKKWIGKPGHPLIRAALDGDVVNLEQERFLISGNGSSETWPIPLTYTINGRRKTILFDKRKMSIRAGNVKDFQINSDRTGFYRVKYDSKLYSVLKRNSDSMSAAGRWGLMTDLFMFLISGEIGTETYFDFAKKMISDRDYLIVSAMNSQLGFLTELVPEWKLMSDLYTRFCNSHLRRIGVRRKAGEDRGNAVLRERLSNGLAMNSDDFAAKMASLFDRREEIEPELRQAIAISYGRINGENGFERLVREMSVASSDQDAMKIAIALVSFKEEALNRRALELSFTGKINIGHIAYMVIAASSNTESKDAVWKWFTANSEQLLKTYSGTGLNSAMVENLISGAGTNRPDEVREYFSKHAVKEAEMGIRKGLELLEAYTGLMKRLRAGM